MKKEKAKRITLYIDNYVYTSFKIYAISIGKSVSELVENYMKEIKGEIENENEKKNIKKVG